jgi:predicted ester cyclase
LQWRETHTGEFNGIPATGKSFSNKGITIDRIVNGQIVERHEIADLMGLMQPIGMIPTPGMP